VQISAGCYAAVAAPDMVSTDFIHAADQALYQAKTAGRNQVVLAASSEIPAPAAAPEGTPDELFQ
jgi:PleD family two-component response regulator